MSIIALLLSLFTFATASNGPGVDVERTVHRQLIENVQPINTCAGTGCR